MRKAVRQIGLYTVKERPTGGWAIYEHLADDPVGLYYREAAAIAAAKKFQKSDVAWAAFRNEEMTKARAEG